MSFRFLPAPGKIGHPGQKNRLQVRLAESELFGVCWAPHDFTEFVALVQWPFVGPGYLSGWRGQANADWPLDSGAYRRLQERPDAWLKEPENQLTWLERMPSEETAMAAYEHELLSVVRMAGHGLSEGRRLSDLELLARLQHHGAATRLVDFTANALIALWFAAQDPHHANRWGVVFGACLATAREIRRDTELDAPMDEQLARAGGEMTFWHPSALSPRIPAQSGFFLWSEVREVCEWSSLGRTPDRAPRSDQPSQLDGQFIAIAISPRLKGQMRFMWDGNLGLNSKRMFPDFDGFSRANGAEVPLDRSSMHNIGFRGLAGADDDWFQHREDP